MLCTYSAQLASRDDDILEQGFDSENISLPLNLTAAAPSSRLLGAAAVRFSGREMFSESKPCSRMSSSLDANCAE